LPRIAALVSSDEGGKSLSGHGAYKLVNARMSKYELRLNGFTDPSRLTVSRAFAISGRSAK
jgi:hypothetical protein